MPQHIALALSASYGRNAGHTDAHTRNSPRILFHNNSVEDGGVMRSFVPSVILLLCKSFCLSASLDNSRTR